MTADQVLTGVSLILVLTVGSQVLASRLCIPALITLLSAGFIVGVLTTTSTRSGCWARPSSRWCHWRWR